MITLKSAAQLAKMRSAGTALWEVLQSLRERVVPGVTTMALNRWAEEAIRARGAIPSFLGYEGFPASLCTSVDDMVVHGIPSEKQALREGSILSMDCGLVLDGWQADSALTVGVGRISAEAERLIRVTEACFFAGAAAARHGNTLGDIGSAVQRLAEDAGCSVVRDLTGHGIGREMHEEPAVYNIGLPGHGMRLLPGMTLAIEPMITLGDWRVDVDEDGWGTRTRDHSLASHYEHTLAVGENGLPEILTLPGFQWKEREDGTHPL